MKKYTFLILIVTVYLISCKRSPYLVDVSGINVDISIKRLEQDIFNMDLDNIKEQSAGLKLEYGNFFETFNQGVLNLVPSTNPAYPDLIKTFITDYYVFQAYEKSQQVFHDLTGLESDLENAFNHYLHYFPEKTVPDVYTYIGGFNQSISIDSNTLAIGLDKYLGPDCEFYSMLGWPQYLIRNLNKDKIPSDCMRAWAITEFEFDNSKDNLLSHIIHEGKILYFTKCMLPNEPDTLVFGFTSDQLKFCTNNENKMWEYLIENKLLFTTDKLTISKFINEGPFTKDFSRESPAQAVNWLGFRIIETYRKKNPGIKLEEIMLNNNYQGILTTSRYNP